MIQSFTFDRAGFDDIKNHPLGLDWPLVYIIENGREVYIGETTSAFNRSKQHFENQDRTHLKNIHLIFDEEFNKSATLDLEAQLIQYFAAEGTLKLQNGNRGLENHNYFDKSRYRAKLSNIWKTLQEMMIVSRNLEEIENTELFKYSPYKALTPDQLAVADELYQVIKTGTPSVHVVNGGPGTGKTILATYLIKFLKEDKHTKHLSIGLVVPMISLRKSLQDVFSSIPGLSKDMVIGPSQLRDAKYDLLIVDEAHRLRQRKNITNYRSHDEMNRRLGLGKEGTELDWVLMSSSQQILFYDKNQSIRPADVSVARFKDLPATHHLIKSQMRVKGGEKYITFIDDLFSGKHELDARFDNFDFQIYDDIAKMVADIKRRNAVQGLCRIVAGFAWPWISRNKPDVFDIEIEGTKLRWNSTTANWVNSENAINEVGCIHTVQGYDLNYVGVIVGPELAYDSISGRLTINEDRYEDQNGWRGIEDSSELEGYIINIYKTLMTRGIRGCYLYFVDKKVEQYFRDRLVSSKLIKFAALKELMKHSTTIETVRIPLVGLAPCGNPLLGEENIEEYIPIPKTKLRSGVKYFIVRAEGDSMNLAGIQNGDLVLCRYGEKGDTGDRVVALLGGENVTIKEYGPRKNNVRLLIPRSTNKKHVPITPKEGDSVQGIVQEIIEIDKA
ncbi:MAG: DNA/RNA helicase domain-containing protein [Candidatus Jorgensenbacteria bacterium]